MTDKDILEISSVQNKSVKEIVSLSEKPKIRREKSLFLIEGGRELKMAAEAGYRIDSVFFEPELLKKRGILGLDELSSIRANAFYKVSPQAYSKMAYRESTEGVLASVFCKNVKLNEIETGSNPLVLVLENIEKPGNIEDRHLQPERNPLKLGRVLYEHDSGMLMRRGLPVAQIKRHIHTYGPVARLKAVLRYGHEAWNGNSARKRRQRPYRLLERKVRFKDHDTDARQNRLA